MSQSEKDFILDIILMHGSLYRNPLPRINEMYIDKEDLFHAVLEFRTYDHWGRFTTERTDGGVSDLSFSNVLERTYKDVNLPKLVVMSGLPCSGKSSELKSFEGFTVISRDKLVLNYAEDGENYSQVFTRLTDTQHKNIDREVRDAFENAVRNKEDIVIDMTNCSQKSRRKWVNTCLKGVNVKRDYFTECIFHRVGLQELYIRNAHRFQNEGKYIGESVYMQMGKTLALPNYFMFDKISYVY